jgi:rare lipoprotein A
VRVRNLVNGRSVDVRINDRGPHIKRRVIDLSRAAARALGVSGTHQVEISLLDRQAR